MTLTVTDAAGRKYRPTGQFREPAQGEYVWCTGHLTVEQRHPDKWCFVDPPWKQHRIIVEPLPVEYEVTVTLDKEAFDLYRQGWPEISTAGRRISEAIAAGMCREVSRD